eukprot:XP_011674836.1 PREDICTED: uncharacterized protein LOC763171 [Strongylocentrotus purpuratus]
MYSGDDCEETGEDVELERYGLTEGQNSGSGESDTEEALYRQVHYNIGNDNNIQSTAQGDSESNIGIEKSPPAVNSGNGDNGETSSDTADFLVASDNDDDDDDLENNWRRIGSDSKYNVSFRTKTKHGIADIQSSRKKKAVFIVKDDSGSDVIFLDVRTKAQEIKCEEKVKQEEGNPRKRSWRKTSDDDDDKTKVTKIDRTSFSSARQATEPSATSSRTSKVVVIADDSSSSSVVVLDSSERSEEDVAKPKQRPLKDGGEFFLDSKGMALEDVHREKDSAELGWKAERMKTKAMLKEGVEIIDLSSGEEDCMVIGSCSEEEGLHVHFDDKGDQTLPQKKDSSRINKWKGRENVAPGRYFVQSRQKHIRCHNCNEMGHQKSECPKPLHIPACVLCGTRGHTDRNCPDQLCFNCSLPGHQSKACPVKRHIRYARCTRCQMQGHLRKMCPDIWRQYHLTTEHGPIVRPSSQHHRTKQKDLYCSNCSKKGHRYFDCRSGRFDEFVVFTYDKVCLYDRKHIGKMVYPAENKNAEYLKLCREREGGAPTSNTKKNSASITEKDSTTVTQEPTINITKRVSSGLAGISTTSIRKENSQPHSNKRKLSQEREKEEEPIQEKEVEFKFKFIEKDQTSKKKVLNPVHTFVRSGLFGGRKGRCWAKQDEDAIFPSERNMEEIVWAPEEKPTKAEKKAEKKAQRKALNRQKKQEAKSKRLEKPENAAQDLADAKLIKHSAVVAMNAVKREIRAALMKKKEKAAPIPKEVTALMSKEQKNAIKKKRRSKEKQEVQLALKERKEADVGVRKVARVFKEAQKLCREAKKRKREVDQARRAQYVPRDRQYPVHQEPGYATSQRGFNLNNRLLEGTHHTHHQNNRWTPHQADPWDQPFPRSNATYDLTNRLFCNSLDRPYSPTFMEQPHSNSPGFVDGPNNHSFTESLHSGSQSFSGPKGKRKRNRRKRKNKQMGS